jgi:hypothetical protein
MRHVIIASGLAALLALDAQAQNTNLAFTPGKLAVYRGGDGILTIKTDRCHPAFIDEYDPALTNQANPILSVELPTNGANALWFNAHAGSEGQGLTRSADRQYLTMTGYSGVIGSISGLTGTPSSATNSAGQSYPRGFGVIDAFTNYNLIYASDEWYGIQPGITQNNPRGIATDGSNDFWGCGTIAGTQTGGAFVETGTLYYGNNGIGGPFQVQNLVNSAYSMKIISGVLYMVCQTGTGGAQEAGVYNFIDFSGAVVPLDYAPGNEAKVLNTNLFLPFGGTYANIVTFDMNPAGTVAYAADETYGIVKFVNSAGTWSSPYYFNSNNIGSTSKTVNPKGATGCFGIAVDFSQTNPVIYATTTDEGDGANLCSNRLISVVDYGTNPAPTTLYAQTLAVANGTNECFRGVDFTPDLLPLITLQPVSLSLTTNEQAIFSVGATSPFSLAYQWQDNGTNVEDNSNISGATSNILTIEACLLTNAGDYTLIVSNQYGAVTSQIANLVVSATAVAPSLTNGVVYLTNFIGHNEQFSITAIGTPPFAYQWYHGTAPLVDDGVKYFGSTNSALYVTNLQLSDSGSYYITVSNQAGGISNLVAVLTVQYVLPVIPVMGQPSPVTMLEGQTATLSVSSVEGTPPLSYQWYQGSTANPLQNLGEFSGATNNTLTITGATLSDAANYFCIVTNAGGSTTSQLASVTVLVPPALSYVAYSNQIYSQNFDSLPDPGTVAVNTISGGGPTTIGGITYDVADPFDFAFPLYDNVTTMPSGGLNLAATMSGWYGETDGDYAPGGGAQLGAADGTTTTGGIYSFGLTTSTIASLNRALGLIATGSSGGTHFGLKLINETTSNLNYVSLDFVGEFWKTGTKPKTMVFSYDVDAAGNASTLSTNEILAASNNPVSSLTFSFPTAGVVGGTNGTLPGNQTNLAVTNLALASPWTPGSALWLVWSIYDDTGSGQGYGIDNFNFYASSTNVLTPGAAPLLGSVVYSSTNGLTFGFTSAPGNGTNFSVLATTNLTVPLNQWLNLGNPTEVSFGAYQFTDAQATNNSQTFYTVISP